MSYPPPWQAQSGLPNYDPNMQYHHNHNPNPNPSPNPVTYPQVAVLSPYGHQPQYYYQPQPPPPMPIQNAPPPQYVSGAFPLQPQYPHPFPTHTFHSPIANPPMPSPAPRPQPHVPTANQVVEPPPKPPADNQSVLLGLADEYLNAAHDQGPKIAVARRKEDEDQYYKLVATALGCLESVLKNWKLEPRTEAMIRLKYATILYEETENTLEAETTLSNGIDVCDRNRLYDLKYSQQELRARVLHTSNRKTAVKEVDRMIAEVVAFKKPAWEYHFRFLRMSFALAASAHQDTRSAVHSIKMIADSAANHRHNVVVALCYVMEALIHLQSVGTDCIEQAQTALASARSFQLDQHVREVPQIAVLVHFIDLSCSLQSLDVQQATQKADEIRQMLEGVLEDSRWRDDGSFTIPIRNQSDHAPAQSARDSAGIDSTLTFDWLPRQEVYAIGYLLNGITLSPRNAQDGRKAEKYLLEGLRITKESISTPKTFAEALHVARRRLESNRILHCQFLVQLTFLRSSRGDWKSASDTLADGLKSATELGNVLPAEMRCLLAYLQGVIYQGTGDLQKALSSFQRPELALPPQNTITAQIDVCRDTAILAALDSVLILRDPRQPQTHRMDGILESVQPFCVSSSSKYIQAAYNLVRAAIHPDEEASIKRKEYLQYAFKAATAITNNQITCIALSYMSWKIFSGVIGAQAEKSSWASRAMAQKAGNGLWVSVADNLLANTLDREGKTQQAMQIRNEALKNAATLPEALTRYKMMAVEI